MKAKKILRILLILMMMGILNGCGKQEPLPEMNEKAEKSIEIETERDEEYTEDIQEEIPQEEDFEETPYKEEPQQQTETQTVVHVPNPSWDYYIAEDVESQVSPVKLVQITEEPNNITDTEEWFERNQLSASMESDDPYIYVIEAVDDFSERYPFKVYEKDTGNLVADMDFADYLYADDFVEQERAFVRQEIQCAKVQDQILYVSIGHNTYASSSPHNAYIVAIDLSDMSVIWKTEPLVSNAKNFEIIGDVILCAYGFTEEDDYLNQLDIKTGKVIDRIPLKTKADYIIRKGDTLYVRTYNTDYTFDILSE